MFGGSHHHKGYMTLINNVLQQLDFNERIDDRVASISAAKGEQATVIAISGEIDASNADFTQSVLDDFVTCKDAIVIDLSGLDFIGTQGLRLLIEFDEHRRRVGGRWTLVACPTLRRLVEAIGMGAELPLTDVVESAVAPPQSLPCVAKEKLRC